MAVAATSGMRSPARGLTSALLAVVAARAAAQRLRITNGCDKEPLWVAHMAGADSGPDPQNARLKPGEHRDFDTHDGLSATRYWPKMRCNEQGSACLIGESGGPGQECDETMGCAPPIDSKFEGTFGTEAGIDWIDVSLVDGWTLPFKFKMTLKGAGKCNAGDGNRSVLSSVDCSRLTLDKCPSREVLNSEQTNLQVIHPQESQVVGCYSPCAKLTSNNWDNKVADGVSPADTKAVKYCCPTPPESPQACRSGPVEKTSFVKAVHKNCPGVYGYSYDDGMGLITCPKDTKYEMIFYCPDGQEHTTPEPEEQSEYEEWAGAHDSEAAQARTTPQPEGQSEAVRRHTTPQPEVQSEAVRRHTTPQPEVQNEESEEAGSEPSTARVAFLLEEERKHKFHEYCGDKQLFEGLVEGQLDCQNRCRDDGSCAFYSYWGTGHVHWCKHTSSCKSRKSDVVENVTMYRKIRFDKSSTTTAPAQQVCCFEESSLDDPCGSDCRSREEVSNGFCVPRETWCETCTEDGACKGRRFATDAAKGGASKEDAIVVMRKDEFHAMASKRRGASPGRSPLLPLVGAMAALVAASAFALKFRRLVTRRSGTVVRTERVQDSPLRTPDTPGAPTPPRSP